MISEATPYTERDFYYIGLGHVIFVVWSVKGVLGDSQTKICFVRGFLFLLSFVVEAYDTQLPYDFLWWSYLLALFLKNN